MGMGKQKGYGGGGVRLESVPPSLNVFGDLSSPQAGAGS